MYQSALLLLGIVVLVVLHQHSSSLVNMNFTAFLVAARLRRAIARSNLRTEYWQTDRAVIRFTTITDISNTLILQPTILGERSNHCGGLGGGQRPLPNRIMGRVQKSPRPRDIMSL